MYTPISLSEDISINYNINIDRGNLVCIHISDIHFGAFNPERQYKILKEQFLDRIYKLKFDILSIDGDLFDHKCMANSDIALYANTFISNIIDICRIHNATLIIINGTRSHDAGQLKLFYHYVGQDVDIRIIERTKFEIVKGAKILCIPEEYGMGEAYYNQFLWDSGYYDMCFMHGCIVGCYIGANERDLNSERNPIFSIDDFGLCRGNIISGHIHVCHNYNKYFYYCGSPYRWQFGEENPKGFLITLNDLNTGNFVVKLEEIISDSYITINIDNILNYDSKRIIKEIEDIKKNRSIDYLRCIVSKADNDYMLDNLRLIKNYYRNSNTIRIDDRKYQRHTITEKEDYIEKNSEYDFLFTDNLSPEDNFVKYVNMNKGYEFITVEELMRILS